MTPITEPGVYDRYPENDYHADPIKGGSLSNSAAKYLIPPYTPAHFKAQRTHETDAMIFGRAVHAYVLGVGADVTIIDAPNWRTKAAREARDEALSRGLTPLLAHEDAKAARMAATVRRHPRARQILDLPDLKVEQSLFWQDPTTGVWLRARLDIVATATINGEPVTIVADYKTHGSIADTNTFGRAAADYGYARQAAWYLEGAAQLGLVNPANDPIFLHIVQEKDDPHLVNVVEADVEALRVGQEEMRYAIDTYARCKETGEWPGHPDDIQLFTLPHWAITQHDAKELA